MIVFMKGSSWLWPGVVLFDSDCRCITPVVFVIRIQYARVLGVIVGYEWCPQDLSTTYDYNAM